MTQIDVLRWLAGKSRRKVPRGRLGIRTKVFNELCLLGQASWLIDRAGTWVWATEAGVLRLQEACA